MTKKIMLILILTAFFVPFIAQAGLLDFLGDLLGDIICILTGLYCPDPCLRLGRAAAGLCHLVDRIGQALYIIGWSLAMVILLWGGISYMTSGGEEEKVTNAKKIIKSGLIGAAIVLCAGFILSLLVEFLAPLFYY